MNRKVVSFPGRNNALPSPHDAVDVIKGRAVVEQLIAGMPEGLIGTKWDDQRHLAHFVDPETGTTLLHAAIVGGWTGIVRKLVEVECVEFRADAMGRWPSTMAILSKASPALCDYVTKWEAHRLGLAYE